METPPAPTKSPEAHAEATHTLEGVFSRDAIKDVRTTQKETYYLVFEQAIRDSKDVAESKQLAETSSLLAGHDYLDQYSDESWLKDDLSEGYALIDKYSFARMSDAEWISAERDDDGNVITPSGINQLQEDVRTFGEGETTETSEPGPEREFLQHELEELRDQLATLSAKRQGSLLNFGKEKYEQTLAAYNTTFTALARLELTSKLNDESMTPVSKNALVISRYFEEQQKLRDLSKDKLEKTTKGQIINALTSGTKKQRFWKAVAFGAGAATVGALAGGVVAGVAGTAALAGGVAATVTAAARFAKGYAHADAKNGYGMSGLTDVHLDQTQREVQARFGADIFDAVQKSAGNHLESDTKKEKQKRWKSVAKGVGAAAIGGVFATGIAVASDFVGSGSIGDWMNRDDPIANHIHSALHPDALDIDTNTGGGGTGTTELAGGDISTPEAPVFDPNFWIDSGEGGISFFQSLGLNEAQWYEVSGELRNNFPNEFYTEGYDVRISHPGQLSIEAQQFIKNRFGL